MKEITNHQTGNTEEHDIAPGYAWILVTGVLLALIFLPIVVG